MKRNALETVMSLIVLTVAASFLVFAYSVVDPKSLTGYIIKATFQNVGGLEEGGDVRMSGITMGRVVGISLEQATFRAAVTMSIASNVSLPADTVASIGSVSLTGSKYVNLVPGHANNRIPPGGSIVNTRGYRSLEDIVGETIFSPP